jgi:hypothetical protein
VLVVGRPATSFLNPDGSFSYTRRQRDAATDVHLSGLDGARSQYRHRHDHHHASERPPVIDLDATTGRRRR